MPTADNHSRRSTSAWPEGFSFFYAFIVPFVILFSTLAGICFLFTNNAILFFIVATLFTYVTVSRQSRFKTTLIITALFFGTLGEWVCCHYDLWVYANPSFLRLPIWLPMIWPILMVCFGYIAQGVFLLVGKKTGNDSKSIWRDGVFWLFAIAIVIYAIYTFTQINTVIATVFIVFFLLILSLARSRFNIIYFVIAALGGSFGEIVCMQFEVWYYTNPIFPKAGIPLSLPLAWGLSANVIWLIARALSGTYGLCKREDRGFH